MKCSQCGFDIKEATRPCPECGHMMTEQEDLDNIIKDILEEDAIEPTFPEETPEKKVEKPKVKKSTGFKMPKLNLPKLVPSKEPVKTNEPVKANEKETTTKEHSLGSIVVQALRFLLVAIILLFTLSLYFNWFTLNENAVNIGTIRTEENKPFLHSSIRDFEVDAVEAQIRQSDTDTTPILVFSGMDLYQFGKLNETSYKTIVGPSGVDTLSVATLIHRYYMLAMFAVLLVNVLGVLILLIGRRLKGITIVRNLSMLNFVIIGLNYMALKIPFFSMFAIKAKDILNQSVDYATISLKLDGVRMNETFYGYELHLLSGFKFSIAVLGIWLFVGIILSEVKHRRDEIAIEKGEL